MEKRIAEVTFRVKKEDKWQDVDIEIPPDVRDDIRAIWGHVSDHLQDVYGDGKCVNYFRIQNERDLTNRA